MSEGMRRAQLYAVAGVVGVLVIALVVLTLGHADTGPLLAVAAPIFAAFLVLAGVEKNREASEARHADTTARLDQITHQTNGVLTARIEAAVASAMLKAQTGEAPADPEPDDLVQLDPEQAPGG